MALLAAAAFCVACSLERSGLGHVDPDGEMDAGTRMDAGPGEGDAGPSPKDSGPEPDSSGPDAGPAYVGDEPSCEGTVLHTCEDGVRSSKDCAEAGAYCDVDAEGGPACTPQVCTPGARECSEDEGSVVECDARGSSKVEMTCAAGCDPATMECRSIAGCSLPGVTDIPASSMSNFAFDLCGYGDDSVNQIGPGCGSSLGGEDRMFRLVVESSIDVVIDLQDDDGSRPIDTVLYIRTRCDDPSSQIACSDDVGDRRHSRIETTLEPGVYYIVADSYEYRDRGRRWTCGSVRLQYQGG